MEQVIMDPISIEVRSFVEDWMALGPPPSSSSLLFTPQSDEIDDLGSGFDDLEILNRVKIWEDNSSPVEIKCDKLIEPDSKELALSLDSSHCFPDAAFSSVQVIPKIAVSARSP